MQNILRPPLVCLITDDTGREAGSLAAVAAAAIRGGCDCVQLREKHASPAALRACLRALHEVCQSGSALLLLNADCVAAAGDDALLADGIHHNIRTWAGRASAPPAIGYSAHKPEEAAQAVVEGAVFVTMGPVFETTSKPGAEVRGLTALREARARMGASGGLLALGGITAENAGAAIGAGAGGVAVISAIMGAPDPEEAARLLRGAVDRALAARPIRA